MGYVTLYMYTEHNYVTLYNKQTGVAHYVVGYALQTVVVILFFSSAGIFLYQDAATAYSNECHSAYQQR